MIRFYSNQLGYLPQENKVVVLAARVYKAWKPEFAQKALKAAMVVLNRAMILTVAFLLTGEKKYKVMAQRQMDYILGENATGVQLCNWNWRKKLSESTPPMKCFLDIWECYSLNEITIYWNFPAIFVAAFLAVDV